MVIPNWALADGGLDRVKVALPRLVSVMFCGNPVVPTVSLGKVKLPGERSAVGPRPEPKSGIVCGLLGALSTNETAAA